MKQNRERLPIQERRLQIINCALEVFAGKGFSGARTKEIAELAGISETLIFQIFGSKKKLYLETLKTLFKIFPEELLELAEKKDDYGVFQAAAVEISSSSEMNPNFTRLLFFAALDNFRFKDITDEYGPKLFKFLSDYIKIRIADGAFRKVNADLAANMFAHSVFLGSAEKVMELGENSANYSAEEHVEAVVDIFMVGIKICRTRSRGLCGTILPF